MTKWDKDARKYEVVINTLTNKNGGFTRVCVVPKPIFEYLKEPSKLEFKIVDKQVQVHRMEKREKGQDVQTPPHTDNSIIDRLNQLIEESFRLIRSSPNGAYMKDLKNLLGISQEEMSGLATRLKRIEGMKIREIVRETSRDFLFTYNGEYAEQAKSDRKPLAVCQPEDVTHDHTESLARQMLDEYNADKRRMNKSLQQRLIKEFVDTRSLKIVMRNNPDIPKEEIKRLVKTPLRLPKTLRTRNEEGLHPDPQISLQIALFAVNHHDWDDSNTDTKDVLQTAESIARHVIAMDAKSTDTESQKSADIRENIIHSANSVPIAVAVWIAVATMHKEHGIDSVFSANDIVKMIIEQNLCNASRGSIQAHVSAHCVANAPTRHKTDHRKIYRVSLGRYRLYKRNESHHPTRKGLRIAPLPLQIPSEYRDLRRWYDEEYCAQP